MMAVAAAQKNREMFAIKKSYSIENGYGSRRRSLVEDARFEALVVAQTKQSALEDARQRAHDDAPAAEEVSQQQEEVFQPDELPQAEDISSADEESAVQPGDGSSSDEPSDAGLTEDEMLVAAAVEAEGGAATEVRPSLLLRLRDGATALARVLRAVEGLQGEVEHVETRAARAPGARAEALLRVRLPRPQLLPLLRTLRQSPALAGVTLLQGALSVKDPWFPRHASDLDNCNHLMTKYEPELDMSHPGFADKEYRSRRKMIADIAFSYKHGDSIPNIDYTAAETSTWGEVFANTVALLPRYACAEYRRVFGMLQDAGIFTPDRVPQLNEMSAFLTKHTGFRLRPAAGLLTARDFLASLAFRVFQSTQYVRHTSSPHHTPEPDCIHEMIGHMPLLADPHFAQFSQEIGLASLGASDAEIEKLSTVYWFTVEFGLCKEAGQLKAYGAGLLSSTRELLHAVSDKPERRPFDPASTALQPYQDQDVQPVYYVAESFQDAKDKFRRWVETGMSRSFEVRFDPHTQRVEVLDSVGALDACVRQMQLEMMHLNNALAKLRATSA